MDSSEIQPAPGFEDVLTAAVDRQISEQRALQDVLVHVHESLEGVRQTLAERTDALRGSIEAGPQDLAGLPDAVRNLSSTIRERLTDLESRIAAPPADLQGFSDRLTETIQALPDALGADVRAAMGPAAESLTEVVEGQRESLRDISESVESLRQSLPSEVGAAGLDDLAQRVSTASEDVHALAQAVLDLNAGLRDWSERLTDRMDSMSSDLMRGLQDLSDTQRRTLDSVTDSVVAMVAELREDVGGLVRETARSLGARLGGVEEQLVEAGELAGYLRDQTEDLDKVLTSLGDVPQRLEGAVAQALRRALTVRAGLLAEAEKTLEKVFGPVSGRMDEMVGSLDSLRSVVEDEKLTEELRRLALRQVELDSRIDELEGSIVGQLEDLAEAVRDSMGAGDVEAAGARPKAKPKSKSKAKTKAKAKSRSRTSAGTKKTAAKSSGARRSSRSGTKKTASSKTKTRSTKAKGAAKSKAGSRQASGSRRTRKAAGKTRTRDYIPV